MGEYEKMSEEEKAARLNHPAGSKDRAKKAIGSVHLEDWLADHRDDVRAAREARDDHYRIAHDALMRELGLNDE